VILYKYLRPERIDVLDTGMIMLSRPRAFNDPFELSPDVASIDSGIKMVGATWAHTKDRVVLSLAENRDSLLMWGHYTDGHKGILIGFDADDEILAEPSKDRRLARVVYAKTRPSRPNIEDFTEEELYFTKSDEWAYEREWRILDSFEAASGSRPGGAPDTWPFRLNPQGGEGSDLRLQGRPSA